MGRVGLNEVVVHPEDSEPQQAGGSSLVATALIQVGSFPWKPEPEPGEAEWEPQTVERAADRSTIKKKERVHQVYISRSDVAKYGRTRSCPTCLSSRRRAIPGRAASAPHGLTDGTRMVDDYTKRKDDKEMRRTEEMERVQVKTSIEQASPRVDAPEAVRR